MSAFAGSLVPVEASLVPLVLVPLFPLVAALVIALFGVRVGERRSALLSLGGTLLALFVSLANIARLAELPSARRSLFEVVARLVRVGSFDANLAFVLDPRAAVFLLSALVALVFVQVKVWQNQATTPLSLRFSATSSLLAAGVALVVLAADFVGVLFGFCAVGVATYLFADRSSLTSPPWLAGKRGFLVSVFGDQCLLLGFGLLFWGLGGAWLDGQYLSDYRSKFVAVHAEGRLPVETVDADDDDDDEPPGERDARVVAARMGEHGSLTFASLPGARVVLGIDDQAQLVKNPAPFGVAPFVRKELGAGVHSLVVLPGGGGTVTGDGNEVAWIERMVVADKEDVELVPLGSTITFREIQNQLSIHDEAGVPVLKRGLAGKPFWGPFDLITWVGFLLGLGVAAKASMSPFFGWFVASAEKRPSASAALIAACVVSLPVYLLVRLDVLFAMSATASAVLVVVGAVSALLALVRVLREPRPGKALAALSVLLVGLSLVALGLHASAVTLGLVVANALVAVLFGLASTEVADARFERVRRLVGVRVAKAEALDAFDFGGALVEVVTSVASGALWFVSAIESIAGAPALLVEKQEDTEPEPASAPVSAPASASASASASAPVSAPVSASAPAPVSAPAPRRKKPSRRSK